LIADLQETVKRMGVI